LYKPGGFSTRIRNHQGQKPKHLAKKFGIEFEQTTSHKHLNIIKMIKRRSMKHASRDLDTQRSWRSNRELIAKQLTELNKKLESENYISFGQPTDSFDIIQWNKRLQLGIASIDDQHERLVEMINQLYRLIRVSTTERHLYAYILGSLVEFSLTHFENEHVLMNTYVGLNDEENQQHRKEHELFREKILDFEKRFKENELEAFEMELLNYLTEWIMEHVLKRDKQMAKRMRKMIRREHNKTI
jgi:hemerythrin-like metal-binding protein